MFIGAIKGSIRKALEELIDENILGDLAKKAVQAFSKEGIDLTKITHHTLSNIQLKYSLKDKALTVEFKKDF